MHSTGIEPALKASEAFVLSVRLRVQILQIYPETGIETAGDLREMISEVNSTLLAPEWWVSSSGYEGYYHILEYKCYSLCSNPLLHEVRHTSISYLINKGVDIKKVADRAGHQNTRTTEEIYGHIYAKTKRATADIYDDLFTGKDINSKWILEYKCYSLCSNPFIHNVYYFIHHFHFYHLSSEEKSEELLCPTLFLLFSLTIDIQVRKAFIELMDWEDSGYLFISLKTGKVTRSGGPMLPDVISQWFSKFLERNNLPKITLHEVRHTSISRNGLVVFII